MKEPSENFIDEHLLFMRVHKCNIFYLNQKRIIRPVAFDAKGEGGLSVDWNKHSTASETLSRSKVSDDNGVISIPVAVVRNEPIPMKIEHVPVDGNFSHSEIFGIPPRKPSDMGARVKLMDASKWEIYCVNEII